MGGEKEEGGEVFFRHLRGKRSEGEGKERRDQGRVGRKDTFREILPLDQIPNDANQGETNIGTSSPPPSIFITWLMKLSCDEGEEEL